MRTRQQTQTCARATCLVQDAVRAPAQAAEGHGPRGSARERVRVARVAVIAADPLREAGATVRGTRKRVR
jgi:hypothetical protein